MQLQVETQIYKKDAIGNGIIDAGTKADYYITYINPQTGIQVHSQYINPVVLDGNGQPPYGNYVQINGDDISMWRNNKKKMSLDDTYLTFYDGNGVANNNKLAHFGSDIKIYKPGTGLAVIDINNQGAYIDGSVQIGGHAQSEYLNSNIKLGGTNLLRDSTKDKAESHTTYPIADFNFSESLIEGQQYTITAKITTSSEKKSVGFYHSGGSYSMSGWLPVSSDGYYNVTFTATAAMATQTSGLGYGYCRVYVSNNTTQQGSTTVTGTAHVDWIKIEKGNKATDWSPAPEDIDVHQYLRMEDGKLNIYQGNTKLASYGDVATIGKDAGPKFNIEGSTLKAYDDNGNQYFEVSSSGIKFGNNIQVASTNDVNNTVSTTKGNYTILWNYENFSTQNNGEAYICKLDALTNTASDANGTIMWNGTNRTISKQMVNPNTIAPYNIPIYIVCRLSNATATTGTNYIVWYNSGWKYAILPTPSAVGGTWTWDNARDIIIGKFVEPGSENAFIDYEIYNPPLTSKQLTTNNITAASATANAADATLAATGAAEAAAIAATKATNYLSVDDDGLKVSESITSNTSPYILISSSGMTVYNQNNSNNLQDVAFFGATARIGVNNSSRFLLNSDSIEGYGIGNNSTVMKFFEVNQQGIFFRSQSTEGTDLYNVDTLLDGLGDNVDELQVYTGINNPSNTSNTNLTGKINLINNTLSDYSTIKNLVTTHLGSNKALYLNGSTLTLKNGSSTSFQIEITSSAMNLKQSSTNIAWINNSKLNTNNLLVNTSLELGSQFKWQISSNRISLIRV